MTLASPPRRCRPGRPSPAASGSGPRPSTAPPINWWILDAGRGARGDLRLRHAADARADRPDDRGDLRPRRRGLPEPAGRDPLRRRPAACRRAPGAPVLADRHPAAVRQRRGRRDRDELSRRRSHDARDGQGRGRAADRRRQRAGPRRGVPRRDPRRGDRQRSRPRAAAADPVRHGRHRPGPPNSRCGCGRGEPRLSVLGRRKNELRLGGRALHEMELHAVTDAVLGDRLHDWQLDVDHGRPDVHAALRVSCRGVVAGDVAGQLRERLVALGALVAEQAEAGAARGRHRRAQRRAARPRRGRQGRPDRFR